MTSQEQLQDLSGKTAYDRSDDKIGAVGTVYADDQTGEPSWVTVSTGLFGTHESFVPVQGSRVDGDRLVVAYDKAQVKDAPRVDQDGHLSAEEEQELYRYYGLDYSTGTGDSGVNAGEYRDERGAEYSGRTVTDDDSSVSGRHGLDRSAAVDETSTGTVGHDTSGPTTDDAMTLSEERLRVGTERVETGRARLRKHIVTENVTETVPVSREEVRIEREPITDANRGDAYDGPAISEEEHEVVLHAERPVVEKEVEAVERVRLNTETVTGEEQVTGEVRKERVETDGVETTTGTRTDEDYRR